MASLQNYLFNDFIVINLHKILNINIGMNKFKDIKHRIMTDDKVAHAAEYLLSKVVLDKKLPQLRFFYKKHKIVLDRNGLYSVYKPSGEKVANHIHYQEVAKYIIDNINHYGKIRYIQDIENEVFRHREKIQYFTRYNQIKNSELLEVKIESMYDFYHQYMSTLKGLLNPYNQYL